MANDWRYFRKIQIVLVGLLIFVLPFSGMAGGFKRIVVMVTMPVPACEAHLKYFVGQLDDMGYKEGNNMALTIIQANGDRAFAKEELQKIMKKDRPDAVVTIATLASQAALEVFGGTDVPVFFFQVTDPVGAGLIQKKGVATGTNITGRIFTVPAAVRIELAMRLTGQAILEKRPVRFGYIYSDYPSAKGDIQSLTAVEASRKDIQFETVMIPYEKVPEGIPAMLKVVDEAIQAISNQVDFWWQPQGPLGEINEYTSMLLEHSTLPVAMGQTMESVKMGALFHITPDLEAGGREAAKLVDAILKGADPGKIPVTPPAAFQLGINLSTALKMNIIVPPDILELAGDHVYR